MKCALHFASHRLVLRRKKWLLLDPPRSRVLAARGPRGRRVSSLETDSNRSTRRGRRIRARSSGFSGRARPLWMAGKRPAAARMLVQTRRFCAGVHRGTRTVPLGATLDGCRGHNLPEHKSSGCRPAPRKPRDNQKSDQAHAEFSLASNRVRFLLEACRVSAPLHDHFLSTRRAKLG